MTDPCRSGSWIRLDRLKLKNENQRSAKRIQRLSERAMDVTVNGKRMKTGGATLRDLLIELGIDSTRVVVEHNLEIVPRRMQESVRLCDGDRIEIVRLVGGG